MLERILRVCEPRKRCKGDGDWGAAPAPSDPRALGSPLENELGQTGALCDETEEGPEVQCGGEGNAAATRKGAADDALPD